MPHITDCYLIDFPKIDDKRGSLSFVESRNHIPFTMERVYYLYDVPSDAERGAHAHRSLEQVMLAISGSFNLKVDDGHSSRSFFLNKKYQGVFVPKMIWRDMFNFSDDAVCLVLASEYFDERDYIRDYQEFLRSKVSDDS